MAAPTVPIEIWAYGNVVLPNTHELNKQRPINDLWNKGWDMGEKPACEEFNYVLNMVTAWAKYITGEQIPGLDSRYLRISQNLADVPNKATARTNLDVWSKSEGDARYVNISGDTMTGALSVPRLNFQASSTDLAYITTTNAASDWTYFDFVLGDNPGTAGASGVDTMRFRFSPSGGSIFNMMELNAISATAALCRVTGNIIASGSIQGSTMNATTGTFTNVNVSGTVTTGTLQSTTTRATNLNVTGTGTIATLNATNTTTSSLRVNGTATISTMNATSSTIQNLTVPVKITATALQVNGATSTGSLAVTGQGATVGGRNIVRSVNGSTADGNGNLTLTIPPQGVMDVRLGSEIATAREPLGHESFVYRAASGCVVTGFNIFSSSGGQDEFVTMYARPVQKYLNGAWYTVSQL